MGTWHKAILKSHKSFVENVQLWSHYNPQLIVLIILCLIAFDGWWYFDNEVQSSIFKINWCGWSIFYKSLFDFAIMDWLLVNYLLMKGLEQLRNTYWLLCLRNRLKFGTIFWEDFKIQSKYSLKILLYFLLYGFKTFDKNSILNLQATKLWLI